MSTDKKIKQFVQVNFSSDEYFKSSDFKAVIGVPDIGEFFREFYKTPRDWGWQVGARTEADYKQITIDFSDEGISDYMKSKLATAKVTTMFGDFTYQYLYDRTNNTVLAIEYTEFTKEFARKIGDRVMTTDELSEMCNRLEGIISAPKKMKDNIEESEVKARTDEEEFTKKMDVALRDIKVSTSIDKFTAKRILERLVKEIW